MFDLSQQGLPKAHPAGHRKMMDTGKRQKGACPDGKIWDRVHPDGSERGVS